MYIEKFVVLLVKNGAREIQSKLGESTLRGPNSFYKNSKKKIKNNYRSQRSVCKRDLHEQ